MQPSHAEGQNSRQGIAAIVIQTGGPTSKRRVIIRDMGMHSNLVIAHTFATELEEGLMVQSSVPLHG